MARTTRNVRLLAAASFFNDVASEATLRLLPLFLSQVLGAGTAVIGLIEGIAESTATLMRLASGWLSDHLPRRKPFVVAGYSLSALARPFFLVAGHWTWVLLIRFADRLGKGARSAPRDALIADEARSGSRGASFGLNRAMDTLGAILGLSVAYAVLRFGPGAGARELTHSAFQAVVLLTTIPALLAIAVVAVGVREAPRARAPHPESTDVPRPLPAAFWRYIGVLALFTLANSSDAFLALRASRAPGGVPFVLLCLIATSVSSALIALPAGRLSDRVGRKKLILAGWAVYVVSYAAFALVDPSAQAGLLLATFFLYGAFYGLSEGAERSLVADLVARENRRGLAYGVFNFVAGLMALPSSLIFGIGVERWGEARAFLAAAALALAATLGLACLVPERVDDRSDKL